MSGLWVYVTLVVNGSSIKAQVFSPGQNPSVPARYLNSSGQWQETPAWALQATDPQSPREEGPGWVVVVLRRQPQYLMTSPSCRRPNLFCLAIHVPGE
jgi:hypothetical protein